MAKPKPGSPSSTDTVDEILAVGQELIQTRGFDGFSYRDVADRIGIKSASIHYHFPTKADLGLAIATAYREDFSASVAVLDGQGWSARKRLRGYAGLFKQTLVESDRVCLCGMLASEAETLPTAVRQEIERFFHEQRRWIATTVAEGMAAGTLVQGVDAQAFAATFLSALEGGMIIARSLGEPGHLEQVADHLLATLDQPSP